MEAFLRAAVDSGSAGGGGQGDKTRFFQHADFWVVIRCLAQGGKDTPDGGFGEEGGDAGAESGVVDSLVTGPGETIDANGARVGEIIGGQVHLDRGMDFQQEEDLFSVADQVSAEGAGDLHTVIDLP